jgi:DNA polymerase elongation subunit (family B)
MLNSKPINKVLWFDIEAVPEKASFFELTPKKQELFKSRFKKDWEAMGADPQRHFIKEMITAASTVTPVEAVETLVDNKMIEALYNNKAPLHPEFGKIVCISIGYIDGEIPEKIEDKPEVELKLKLKSFYGHDEVKLLQDFLNATKSAITNAVNPTYHLCGHNIMNYDVPFIAKRFIINGLKLPAMFDLDGKKEWNLPYFIDTRNVWKFNVYDSNCSLDLLCNLFDVESSKEGGISGKDVRDVFYIENDVQKIAMYCEEDVRALAQVYLKMKSLQNKLTVI